MITCRHVSRVLSRPPEGTPTVISLAPRLPAGSSSLPEGRSGPDQSCPLIWPCSRWGLPSQPVTRLLVGSYIKGPKSPHLFTITAEFHMTRYTFCCTFHVITAGGRSTHSSSDA